VRWAGGRLSRLALAVCVAYGAGIGAETLAAGPPFGSRNFTPPGHVPNYFSNESGPFRGGGGGQTASPVVAAPGPAGPSQSHLAASHGSNRCMPAGSGPGWRAASRAGTVIWCMPSHQRAARPSWHAAHRSEKRQAPPPAARRRPRPRGTRHQTARASGSPGRGVSAQPSAGLALDMSRRPAI
jgi:hypothetical protein